MIGGLIAHHRPAVLAVCLHRRYRYRRGIRPGRLLRRAALAGLHRRRAQSRRVHRRARGAGGRRQLAHRPVRRVCHRRARDGRARCPGSSRRRRHRQRVRLDTRPRRAVPDDLYDFGDRSQRHVGGERAVRHDLRPVRRAGGYRHGCVRRRVPGDHRDRPGRCCSPASTRPLRAHAGCRYGYWGSCSSGWSASPRPRRRRRSARCCCSA